MRKEIRTIYEKVKRADQAERCYSSNVIQFAIAVFSGVVLGLVGFVGSLTYESIAAMEGIHDQRARQVTVLFGCWLSALWLTSIVSNVLSGYPPTQANSFICAIMRSKARRLVGAIAGLCIATVTVSAILIGIASLPILVVTPSAAWLIMTATTGIGGLVGMRRFW